MLPNVRHFEVWRLTYPAIPAIRLARQLNFFVIYQDLYLAPASYNNPNPEKKVKKETIIFSRLYTWKSFYGFLPTDVTFSPNQGTIWVYSKEVVEIVHLDIVMICIIPLENSPRKKKKK